MNDGGLKQIGDALVEISNRLDRLEVDMVGRFDAMHQYLARSNEQLARWFGKTERSNAEILRTKADKAQLDHFFERLDEDAGRQQKDDQERAAMTLQVNRHERRIIDHGRRIRRIEVKVA